MTPALTVEPAHYWSDARCCGIRTADQSGQQTPALKRLDYRVGRGRAPDSNDSVFTGAPSQAITVSSQPSAAVSAAERHRLRLAAGPAPTRAASR